MAALLQNIDRLVDKKEMEYSSDEDRRNCATEVKLLEIQINSNKMVKKATSSLGFGFHIVLDSQVTSSHSDAKCAKYLAIGSGKSKESLHLEVHSSVPAALVRGTLVETPLCFLTRHELYGPAILPQKGEGRNEKSPHSLLSNWEVSL